MPAFASFSLALIPLPFLVGVPVVGLVVAVGIYEYEKHKKAAALPPPTVTVQGANVAQQILSSLPSPFPGDAFHINEQVVRAALLQYTNSPTYAQLQLTLAALQNNGNSASGTPIALSAYNALLRATSSLQAS